MSTFVAPAAGVYYVGISGYSNTGYDPTKADSGGNGYYTGNYTLLLGRLGAGDTRLSGISASAAAGTPAESGVASANVGQTITLLGSGLLSSDQVVFTAIDQSGNLYTDTITPTSVAANGTSLTVVVPTDATTGTVRLARETAGILLQVVPTLSHVSVSAGGAFTGGAMTLTGTGFEEGASAVHFGAKTLGSTESGVSYYGYTPNYTYNPNGFINLTTPDGVPTGPISVSTPGGVSTIYPLNFTAITATAASGAPETAGQASANPGQAITIQGTGLDATTDVVFQTLNSSGVPGQVVVTPSSAAADGTSAVVVVPVTAVTGYVRVIGDENATEALLQIVPIVTGLTVSSVSSDGTSAQVTLSGSGFIEGNDSEYQFGTTLVLDGSTSSGPDVTDYGYTPNYTYAQNGFVTLTVPLSAGAFGSISVTTAGGTSAPFSVSLSSVTGVALSGTPANASIASANPGQAVTLTGTGLSTSTGVIFRYTDSSGTAQTVLLKPTAASGDGTSATLVVPAYADGVTTLSVLGSSTQPELQIVPVLNSYNVSGGTLQLIGAGFVEGAATYQLGGTSVVDTSTTAGPDVTDYAYDPNSQSLPDGVASISGVTFGFGAATVTTAGGTSTSLTLNAFSANQGSAVGDLAVDRTSGLIWVSDGSYPTKLNLVDPTSGQVTRSLTLTGANPYLANYAGLQVLSSPMTLNGTAVAAGSLLVFDGYANPDTVTALNPTTGATIASLTLANNYDLTSECTIRPAGICSS